MTEQANRDLVWDLNQFRRKRLAAQFVKRFENKLCVYSGSVGQLYSNYNIYFPDDEADRMVILPNPYAHHDTFQGVPEEAVKTTGLQIIPGEAIGKLGLYLAIPVKHSDGSKKMKVMSLQQGIEAINRGRPPENPFLPVLMKGDLREFKQKVPSLHLHVIQLDKLESRSVLERNGIRDVISNKLPSIQ